jgi:beta-galactosidase beta subunit
MSNDENLDKRKKYKEKEDFEYLQNILREEILKNPTVNINSIFFEGYEKYLCEIEFSVIETNFSTFRIAIPNLSELKEKWWSNMHGGKLALFVSNDGNTWNCLAESYKEEDMTKGLIKYFSS